MSKATEKRLRATVRRLRRNIRWLYEVKHAPIEGMWGLNGDEGAREREAHQAEMRKMLK
jgi:hypothetical protein